MMASSSSEPAEKWEIKKTRSNEIKILALTEKINAIKKWISRHHRTPIRQRLVGHGNSPLANVFFVGRLHKKQLQNVDVNGEFSRSHCAAKKLKMAEHFDDQFFVPMEKIAVYKKQLHKLQKTKEAAAYTANSAFCFNSTVYRILAVLNENQNLQLRFDWVAKVGSFMSCNSMRGAFHKLLGNLAT